MKKRSALFFMICCIIVFTGMSAVAEKPKIVNESRIHALIDKSGTAPVIVMMSVDNWKDLMESSTKYKPADSKIKKAPDHPDSLLKSRIEKTAENIHTMLPEKSYKFKRSFKFLPAMALSVNEKALQALAANPKVTNIVEDKVTRLPPITPAASTSTSSDISSPQLNQSTLLIGASHAWSMGYSGKGTYVAILDTGVRTSHEMFSGKKIVEACYSTNDPFYRSETICPNGLEEQTGPGAAAPNAGSHGTHVAGIAAGKNSGYSSGEAYRGIAHDADIISVQVFSEFNGEEFCGDTVPCYASFDSDQISGLEFVHSLRNNYTVGAVNMSLGGEVTDQFCDTDPRKKIIDLLRSAKIATVIATGNGYLCGGVSTPSCISSAIAVGASTKNDVEADYNNYHPTLQEFFAPGSSILSATATGNSNYGTGSGTSMAAPHVAGAFALLREASPATGVTNMEQALKTTGTGIIGLCSGATAIPRINVNLAIQHLIPRSVGPALPFNLLLLGQ